jgi:hypothetical protein
MSDPISKTIERNGPPREPTKTMYDAINSIHRHGWSISWYKVWTTMYDAWERAPIITAEMIASNIPADRRVAPDPAQMSIIDDIYNFAAKLTQTTDGADEPEDRPNTDDATVDHVLVEMRRCAQCWEGDARLMGNVRAKDMIRAINAALSALTSS